MPDQNHEILGRAGSRKDRAGRKSEGAQDIGRCGPCIVRQRGLCGALTRDEQLQFKKISRRRTYRPGETIYSANDESEFFAAVVSGVVKLTKILFDGRQQVVSLLLPPDCVGRPYGKGNTNFAVAATKVELCCYSYSAFEGLLEEFSGLKQRLFEQTLDELDAARDWMVVLGRKTAEERVASLLLLLASRSSLASPTEPVDHAAFELQMKRSEIADFLGLSYETVCRQITALKRKDVIRLTGTRRFAVPDVGALAALSG